jgi:transporter family-2 protein
VVAIAALTRTLGVAVFFVALVTGQLLGGLLIDHFGWFNAPVRPVTPMRLVAAALLLAGMGLMRWR